MGLAYGAHVDSRMSLAAAARENGDVGDRETLGSARFAS